MIVVHNKAIAVHIGDSISEISEIVNRKQFDAEAFLNCFFSKMSSQMV